MKNELLDEEWIESKPNYNSLILWWESRRLNYNLIVGIAGLVTFILIILISTSKLKLLTGELLITFLVVAFGFAFCYNVIYTIGWGLDLLLKRFFNKELSVLTKTIFYWSLILLSMIPFCIFLYLAFYYRKHI
ncbi:hypothetical protein [Aureispira anguillae]|uniref:Uncharacterized protein n=1 Tax=Aureispira anguillae TaxID=2864201 RepID=A0A915YLA9_9BACT|nr:hypothetical protein [Aureispira anguillae]BDS15314.1 hypothetical protein AsAng_0060980 [Aureispira anguillae]